MHKRATAVLFVGGGLLTGLAIAQTPPNPTQHLGATAQQGPVPVFRITVVGHTTPAINYRPRKGDTRVDFVGTALSPLALGNAKVGGKKGYIDIDAKFDHLVPPTQFGPEYLTYVLWAITPEGRSTNLGEVQVKDDEARIHVTTELQAFGMIVTAEPYFAVTQPSDVVVIENSVRSGTKGNIEVIQAKFDLLKRGTYLMNQDTRQLKLKPLEPGAPLDLAEARNAVMLSRFAGADRYADDTYAKAARLLIDAEQAQARHRGGNDVMMAARQAVQTAEDARLISLQRQEEALQAEQRALAQQRETYALDRARAEEAARRQAEIERLNAETARISAERDKAAAEAARLAAEAQVQQARALAAQSERDKATADAARVAAESARLAAEAQAHLGERGHLRPDRAGAERLAGGQRPRLGEGRRDPVRLGVGRHDRGALGDRVERGQRVRVGAEDGGQPGVERRRQQRRRAGEGGERGRGYRLGCARPERDDPDHGANTSRRGGRGADGVTAWGRWWRPRRWSSRARGRSRRRPCGPPSP